jgi:putative ABC transport system ATP-binding protein
VDRPGQHDRAGPSVPDRLGQARPRAPASRGGRPRRPGAVPARTDVRRRTAAVAIARALINTPHLLLADEPTGNLGSQTATGILDLLTRLRRESEMTVIIATHDPQIASRCDRLIRLRDGAGIDDIEISGGYPVDETIRRVGQLG